MMHSDSGLNISDSKRHFVLILVLMDDALWPVTESEFESVKLS